MQGIRPVSSLTALALFVLVSAQGCPPATTPEPAPELTEAEQAAIQNGLRATDALESAASATQNGTSTEALTGRPNTAARTIGTCPVVSTSGTAADTLSLTIDFGSGCTPAYFPGATCSGSATGSVTPSTGAVSVTFNSLMCNGQTVGGTADLAFTRSALAVGLTGAWDLTWTTTADHVTTNGDGMCEFNPTGYVTTISTFNGTVTDPSGTWTLTLADVQTSYATYQSFIPFSGVMTVESPAIRKLWIRFSTATPTTGDVEISFNGTLYAPINILTLINML
jgi:hypothetical protein